MAGLPAGLPSFVKARIGRALYQVVMTARRTMGDNAPELLCTRSGIHWALDLREAVDLGIYLRGAFEPDLRRLVSELLRPGMVALDVGANVGSPALDMARLVGPEGRVYAFEPTTFAYQKILRNAELNPFAKDVLHVTKAFVGDTSSKTPTSVYSSWKLDRLSEGHKDHAGHLMSADGAPTVTIDQFVEERGIERVDLVKIDVDGFELNVIRGGLETFTRLRPYIVLELCEYTQVEAGTSVRELTSTLIDIGYAFHTTRMKKLPNEPDAIARVIPPRGVTNVLAVPPGRGV